MPFLKIIHPADCGAFATFGILPPAPERVLGFLIRPVAIEIHKVSTRLQASRPPWFRTWSTTLTTRPACFVMHAVKAILATFSHRQETAGWCPYASRSRRERSSGAWEQAFLSHIAKKTVSNDELRRQKSLYAVDEGCRFGSQSCRRLRNRQENRRGHRRRNEVGDKPSQRKWVQWQIRP